MSSYASAYVYITYDKTKENSLENITWFEMGKNETYKLKKVFYVLKQWAILRESPLLAWVILNLATTKFVVKFFQEGVCIRKAIECGIAFFHYQIS